MVGLGVGDCVGVELGLVVEDELLPAIMLTTGVEVFVEGDPGASIMISGAGETVGSLSGQVVAAQEVGLEKSQD